MKLLRLARDAIEAEPTMATDTNTTTTLDPLDYNKDIETGFNWAPVGMGIFFSCMLLVELCILIWPVIKRFDKYILGRNREGELGEAVAGVESVALESVELPKLPPAYSEPCVAECARSSFWTEAPIPFVHQVSPNSSPASGDDETRRSRPDFPRSSDSSSVASTGSSSSDNTQEETPAWVQAITGFTQRSSAEPLDCGIPHSDPLLKLYAISSLGPTGSNGSGHHNEGPPNSLQEVPLQSSTGYGDKTVLRDLSPFTLPPRLNGNSPLGSTGSSDEGPPT